jgi:hypothetical protein
MPRENWRLAPEPASSPRSSTFATARLSGATPVGVRWKAMLSMKPKAAVAGVAILTSEPTCARS